MAEKGENRHSAKELINWVKNWLNLKLSMNKLLMLVLMGQCTVFWG